MASGPRYEYDPQAEKLFIRCPTAQHESIVSSLTFRITSEVESRSTHSDTSEHARKIWRRLRSISTSDIKLTDNEGNSFNLQPDISFILKETQTPSFITEVAYSQIERDLAKRAETLIQTSRGDVSTVMGIKIQYPEAKNASLTIWKANFEVIDNEDALTTDQVLGPVVCIILLFNSPSRTAYHLICKLLTKLAAFYYQLSVCAWRGRQTLYRELRWSRRIRGYPR